MKSKYLSLFLTLLLGSCSTNIEGLGINKFRNYYSVILEESYKKADNDDSGFLSQTEFLKYYNETNNIEDEKNLEATRVFVKLDKNEDKQISISEAKKNQNEFIGNTSGDLKESFKDLFESTDLDKNNSLSKLEFKKFLPDSYHQLDYFYLVDKNKNLSIDLKEFEDLLIALNKSALEEGN